MTVPPRTDVLVVGAGPAGLALAASLAQLGVDHVVVDRSAAASSGSRAAAVQPRTLEYLHRIGVAEPLVDDGLRGHGFVVADPRRALLRADYAAVASPFPYLLLISQQQTELRLQQRLEQLGGRVHRGVRLLTLQDEFPGTAATLVDDNGLVRVLNARYVVGCDGLHSQVRSQLGIAFPGDAHESLFAVADVRMGGPSAELDTTFTLSEHGMLITSPLPDGQLRLVAGVPAGTAPLTGQGLTELVALRGGRAAADLRITDVVSSTTYRVQQRVAERMRRGNAFLAGDAAHTHSPAGGQGMSAGIQDAGNLAWKLHAVLGGRASADLLDTYHSERHPVAGHLIGFTSQLMAIATIADARTAALRNDLVAAAAAVPGVAELLAEKLAQLDVDYAERTAGPLGPGRRADPAWHRASDLSWSVVTPRPLPVEPPPGVTAVVAAVDRPVCVRPDGIVADTETAARFLGIGGHYLGVAS